MDNKKTIIASIIGVALLVLTVVGATFAYFTTVTSNDEGETLVTGKTDAIGSISLTNPTSNLHITLNALDMAQDNLNTYWATNDATLNYDSAEVQRDIAVATLTGGEATTHYECSTTINVSVSGTMVAGLQTGDAYIQFGGLLTNKVDLKNVSTTGYPVTFNLNGTDTLSQSVSAAIAIENRNANQNAIAGKELSVRFSNDDLVCQVVETPEGEEEEVIPEETTGTAFAIYSETDNSLRFYKNNDTVNVSETYNDLTATAIYTGFEEEEYTEYDDAPWFIRRHDITKVVFENVISPISTAYWFYEVSAEDLNLTNLDTSNVTNMRSMFESSYDVTITGIENWDTSNVTNMVYMFSMGVYVIPDISGWDVSSVVSMHGMFDDGTINYTAENPLDLSGWDVSKVTDVNDSDSLISTAYPSGAIIPPNFGTTS